MPLCLTAVLDAHDSDPIGAFSEVTIRHNVLESSRRLLESIGAMDRFQFEVVRATTIQYVTLANTLPAVVRVSIGILDWRRDLARVVHTISTDRAEPLMSASVALMRLRPLVTEGPENRGDGDLLGRMPSWTDQWQREVGELLQSVALPLNVSRDSPATWDYKTIVR